MTKRVSIVVLIMLAGFVGAVRAQGNLSAKANSFQPQPASPSVASGESADRVQDGLVGPVRRVKTEIAKLSNTAGKSVEEKRTVLESAAYDLKGKKIENAYFPVAGAALTGQEVYKYDDKGNISEMTLRNADGALVSKEIYKYEYDFAGNWTKMTTSVAVIEGGKLSFEPTEVTYRTIMYYLDEKMEKMLQPAPTASNVAASVPPSGNANVEKPAGVGSSRVNTPAESAKLAAAIPAPAVIDKSKSAVAGPGNVGNPLAVNRPIVETNGEPPALLIPKPLLKPVSGGVLNGSAISLPAPAYPEMARRMRASGQVTVEVIIDENGKVISARATSGTTVLREAAVQAAYRARFSPTKLSGQSVKVAGVINYNFNLSQ
ncbi:MAG: periplasmic protein TonB [Blastocatellia bacterium]|jgi:TonB family protein|nr:periplasmic protein TonB [Blastocatellia bacterium]